MPHSEPKANFSDEQIAGGWSVLVTFGLFVAFLVWWFFPVSAETRRARELERAERRHELQEFTDRRAEEAAIQRRNEIIYEELVREAVRQAARQP